MAAEMTKDDYQAELGRRLRSVRQQKELTLQQVEEKSDGKWKAVVIGAYERGDRAISAAKLVDLADFYDVPITELMPQPLHETVTVDVPTANAPLRLDLSRLEPNGDPMLRPVSRWASTIQRQRGDYNGRVLTLRRDDIRALSVVVGLPTDEFIGRLSDIGVLIES